MSTAFLKLSTLIGKLNMYLFMYGKLRKFNLISEISSVAAK